jgi:hypothetical protein
VSKKIKIAVLGPIPRDHITTFRDEVIEKYGCIMHPAIALSILLGDQGIIYPVTHVRAKDIAGIKEILREYPNIDPTYITCNNDHGDVIQLRFIDQNKRLEKQTGFMDPIVPDDVKNLLDCDAFVFLPVTDFEISLATLKFIKKYSKGTILFDAHGPTNVMTVLGDRLMKFWVDRDQWLPYIDILKMNMEEAKCSFYRKRYSLSELENDYQLAAGELPEFAKQCFTLGVKALYVTIDVAGCLAYYQQNNLLVEKLIPAIKVTEVVDTTGCGDSFAGGLIYGWLTTNDWVKAAQYGNVLGAQRTQGKNFKVFKSLAETQKMVEDGYRE